MTDEKRCDKLVLDSEHLEQNKSIWDTYGSELAGNFGMKDCGKPVVKNGKCEEHQ